jgi:hypothetical protein
MGVMFIIQSLGDRRVRPRLQRAMAVGIRMNGLGPAGAIYAVHGISGKLGRAQNFLSGEHLAD